MSYTYQAIIDEIKREARAGEIGNYTEQYTVDIVGYLNRFCMKWWNENDWDFSKTPISISLAAGETAQQTLASTIGQIIIMGIQGKEGYLKSFTEKQYRQWVKGQDSAQVGTLYGYVKKGLDSSGNIKVLFVNPPASATVIEGEGKTKFSKILLADVAAGTAIPYFPDDFVPAIIQGVAGIFMTAINDSRGPGQLERAEADLESRKGTNNTDPADDVTTPPPDYVMFTSRRRGGTGVV